MIEKLQRLRLLRDDETQAKAERDKILEDLQIVKYLKEIQEKKDILELEIRDEYETKYNETGEKKFGQIGIRITKKLNYEKVDAIDWALENMKVAVYTDLDKKQFETFAKINNLDFVTIDEVPTVTIPTVIKEEEEKNE